MNYFYYLRLRRPVQTPIISSKNKYMHQTIHVCSPGNEQELKNYSIALKKLTINPNYRLAFGVYKWRSPQKTFSFETVFPGLNNWTAADFQNLVNDPQFSAAFGQEINAAMKANVCVIILPASTNAIMMAGFMSGLGKKIVAVLLDNNKPFLMIGAINVLLNGWKEFDNYFLITNEIQ